MIGFKIVGIFAVILILSLNLQCSSIPHAGSLGSREEEALEMLRTFDPMLGGPEYSCAKTVKMVNELRHLGKDGCLRVLRAYKEKGDWYAGGANVTLLCKLLFVIPKDRQMDLGGDYHPRVDRRKVDQFPLFPLVMCDGIPFLLSLGVESGAGGTDAGDISLAICAEFSLIEADLPTHGFEAAAKRLVEQGDFTELYLNSDDLARMISLLQKQGTKG